MNRIIRILAVITLSLAAGACAGRVHVASRSTPPIPEMEPVSADEPDLVIPLPIEEIRVSDLTLESRSLTQTCDIYKVLKTPDKEFMAVPIHVGTKEYRYTENRGGAKKAYKDPEKEIVLRVLDTEHCTTRPVVITKRGDRLIAPSGYDIEAVTRVNGIRWNNWATQYRITTPEHLMVLQNRYPYVKGEGKHRQIIEIVYTGYNTDLHIPELVQAGRDYMRSLAQQARSELRAQKVPSRAIPGLLLADTSVANPEWLSRLGPIEHMDMSEFILDPSWTVEHALIRIGANGDAFAAYTCNFAGACGLMQFTDNSGRDSKTGRILPGTYTALRRAYPEAKLDPDFVNGARNPLNAMKAAYLHFDAVLSRLIDALGADILINTAVLEELEDASYNGGPERAIQAYQSALKHGTADWTQALPTCRARGQKDCLPLETKEYVAAKLRFLRNATAPDR
jgi:hypothetical protein